MTVRYAVVGCGRIARGYHMPALAKLEDAHLVVACDMLEETAVKAAGEFGADAYTVDYREVIEKDDIDLVCIFTKVEMHAEIAIAAVQNGHHVFLQKPFARTLREGQAMIDAAKANNRLLMTSFMHSYHDESLAAAEWIRSGRIGNIEFVRQRNATGNARETVPSYGGALMDIGSHGVDLIRTVTGMDLTAVCARIGPDISPPPGVTQEWDDPLDRPLVGGEANAFMLYELTNGATVSHEVQWSARGGTSRFQMEVYGTKGSLFLRMPRTGEDLAVSLVTDAGARSMAWVVPELPGSPPGHVHHRAILDAVVTGEADPPGAHGMAALRVFEAARRSRETGAWARI